MENKQKRHLIYKMKNMMPLILLIISFFSCKNEIENSSSAKHEMGVFENEKIFFAEKTILKERFAAPKNAKIFEATKNSFEEFLQNLALKKDGKEVQLFNGDLKRNQTAHAAIIDMEVGNKDLQQCADAVMRLKAEYFYKQKEFEKINFHFTNGFKTDFERWKNGERISIKGNACSWKQTNNSVSDSRTNFNAFLEMLFSYAGTASLEKYDLVSKKMEGIKPGDVFIIGGHPGHAVIVVNTAFDKSTKETYFMLAQSYMPAQEIHVLKNPNNETISPWYKVSEIENYLYTPEYTFSKENLKAFKN